MTLNEELSLLDEFIANSSGASNPSVSLEFLRKRQRKYLEKHTMQIESLLLFLADTNGSMKNIMHGRGHIVEGSRP